MTWQGRVHRARFALQALFATVIIGVAVLVGVAQIALPWIVAHPEKISEFLGARLNRKVAIDQVEGRWEGDGPLLILHGVHIPAATSAQVTTVPQAELKINLFSALHRNQSWNEFRLVGLDLHLVRDATAGWRLQGLDSADGTDREGNASALFDLGSLVLRKLTLTIDSGSTGKPVALAADEVRLINSGRAHRVLARVYCLETKSAPLDAVLDYDSDERSGEIYLGGRLIDLAAVLHEYALTGVRLQRGNGRVQVWAGWQHDRLVHAQAEVDLNDVVFSTPAPIALDTRQSIVPRVGLDHLALAARWLRTDQGWSADIGDLSVSRQGVASPTANIHLEKTRADAGAEPVYAVDAESLDLAVPASVAMLVDSLPEFWRRWLYRADPVGTLPSLHVRYAGTDGFDVSARFTGAAWHSVDMIPGLTAASGTLLGDQDAFSLMLPAHTAFGVDAPRVFRQPLQFSEFVGDIAMFRADAGWRLETDAVEFEGAGYGGELRGGIDLHDDGSRPALDAYATITHAEVPASHLFWPINVMPPAALTWLDRGLAGGRIVSGRAAFRGDLSDWPFLNLAGRFEARADVDDARLVYLPDWPAADRLRSVADFVNTGLHIEASSGQVAGNRLDKATADIPDLGEPVLDLDVAGGGAGKDLLAFMKATPIGQRYGAPLLGVSVGGEGKLGFHLKLPIKHAEQIDLKGTVALTDADLADPKYALRLARANGVVRFGQGGFSADELKVLMSNQPATFHLAVGTFTGDPRLVVDASLHAQAPARELLVYAPVLESYADRLDGTAAWNITFTADSDAVSGASQRLTATSDLRGVSLDLPAPLTKHAGDALPMKLVLNPPSPGGSIDFRLGSLMHMHGRMMSPAQPFAARVAFGGDATGALPVSGFAIEGNVAQLDLSAWLDFATGSGGDNDLLAGVDLQAQNLRAYGRDFGAAALKLAQGKDETELTFDGANIAGSLHLPTGDLRRRGVTAQFARLYWPEVPDSEAEVRSSENPANVPPLHIRIDDFRLGDSNFGTTTLESFPIANGTHFDQVSTHSSNVEMRAHGDWLGRPGSDQSTFSIDFSAHNLGRMLDAFGYAGVVDGGQTVAHIEGTWPGAPSTFALAVLDGTLRVSVQEGRIPEANPGAGRIFGLFNLATIPRRLTLDFGDLFKSGFSFDSIEGIFTLKDGNAYTSDLRVKSPAADIEFSGRTGLKAKDYDQTMDVTPHVSGTLMIGGALVGGPVGAAAGALLQSVFKNQINSVAAVRYSVTGNWEKPTITQLSKRPVEPSKPTEKKGPVKRAVGLRELGL